MSPQFRWIYFLSFLLLLILSVALAFNQLDRVAIIAANIFFFLFLVGVICGFVWWIKAIRKPTTINHPKAVERYVQTHWSEIALAAWRGYNKNGRGCVSIWANKNYQISFTHREKLKYALAEINLPPDGRASILKMTDEYNPAHEIAVIFWTGTGKIFYQPIAKN